jgi:hypothetical protein
MSDRTTILLRLPEATTRTRFKRYTACCPRYCCVQGIQYMSYFQHCQHKRRICKIQRPDGGDVWDVAVHSEDRCSHFCRNVCVPLYTRSHPLRQCFSKPSSSSSLPLSFCYYSHAFPPPPPPSSSSSSSSSPPIFFPFIRPASPYISFLLFLVLFVPF